MLADHAARVLAGRTRFGTEAGRQRGQPHGQLILVERDSRAKFVRETSAVGISQNPLVVWNKSSANFGRLPVP